MAKALITGASGQDGHYLAESLLRNGYEVVGLVRPGSDRPLPINVLRIEADLLDELNLIRVLRCHNPDEIYHLAAQSSVATSWSDPLGTLDATGVATGRLLESVRLSAPQARVVLASSSEIFGRPESTPQNEQTAMNPASPYGAAKALSHQLGRMYRDHWGLFVSVAILYSHESPRRPRTFLSQKVVQGAIAISQGKLNHLALGNLDSRQDWGFAEDYMDGLIRTLRYPDPDEFIFATGVSHTVRDWCVRAFERVRLDYRDHVTSDADYWREDPPVPRVGNAAKARECLGWTPTLEFDQLVDLMVDSALSRRDRLMLTPAVSINSGK